MKTGSRLQKQSFYRLTSGKLTNHEQSLQVSSGMSRYELDSQYNFTAQSAGDSVSAAAFLNGFPPDNAALHFFDDYNDILLSNEEKQKRREALNELSCYIEKSYKELKEHGLIYVFENDKNLLFNYQKGQYQREQQLGTALELQTLFDCGGHTYKNHDFLLEEEELLDHDLETLKLKIDAIVEQHLKMPAAKVPKTGEYTIVLKSHPAGVFVHEVLGHLFEEDLFRSQTIFNEQTAINPHITITDYAHTACNKPCLLPVHIDSEGSEAHDVVLIKDGKIRNRMNDRRFAATGNCSGNGRSSMFYHAPQIRMRNTAMEVDSSLLADVMELDEAIVVEKVGKGSSEMNGEMELFVEFGHIVKGGTITGCLRNFVVRGNSLDLLNSISACAGDFSWHLSSCGKNGYSLMLTHGAPSIVLRGLVHGS